MKRSPLKRTPFKKKPYTWKKGKKKSSKGLFQQFKKESKQAEWSRIMRTILDPYFEALGLLYTCELNLPNICTGNTFKLTYAHSKKRGMIATEEPERTRELCEVVRACTACHHEIEYPDKVEGVTNHEQMYKAVINVIERRNKLLRIEIK